MSKAEEMIQAAKMLKENCKKAIVKNETCFLENGQECPFNYKNSIDCRLVQDREPCNWELPTPRRFTDTDILWAKASKEAGATVIKREACLACDCGVAFAHTDIEKTSAGTVAFPTSAFKSIVPGETVPIDEILKEDEQ